MKRVEVGTFRVMFDGAKGIIDKTWKEGDQTYNRIIELEPGELEDLIVAIDAVQGDIQPPSFVPLSKVEQIMREAAHALAVLGVRTRIEFHVDFHVLMDLAHGAGRKIEPGPFRADTGVVSLGVGRLVAVRGRTV